MIDGLQKHCWEYLQHSPDLDCAASLQLLTESLQFSLDLPEEMKRLFCKRLLANSEGIVESPFFLETHGSIIASLIKLDEFNVVEERLWDRLAEWSACAVRKPELLGPFSEVTPCPALKRAKTTVDGANEQAALKEAVFQMMLPHIRCTLLPKDFFVDKVRNYLDREQSDAVMDYFLLGRNSDGLVIKERFGLACLHDWCEPPALELLRLKTRLIGHSGEGCHTINLGGRFQVTSVQITVSCGKALRWSVALGGIESEEIVAENRQFPGMSVLKVSFYNVCEELQFSFSAVSDYEVHSILVEGKKISPELERANQVVQQLSEDIFADFAASANNKIDASQ